MTNWLQELLSELITPSPCFVAAFSSCKVHCEAFTASPHNTPNIHSRYLYCQIIIFRAEPSPRLFSDEHLKEITAQAPTTEFWKRSNKQRGHGSDRRQKQFDLFEKCQTNVKKRFEETVLQCFSHKLLSFVFWKSFGRLLIPNYTPMGNMFNFAPELDDDAHKFNHPLQNVARKGKYNQNWAHLQIKPTRCSECKTTHISRTW